MIQVLTTKSIKKARKKHTCSYCNRTIEVGESYRISNIKQDYDDLYQWKECSDCEIISKELFGSGYFQDDGNGLTSEVFLELAREIHEEFFTQDPYLRFLKPKICKDLAEQFKTHELVLCNNKGPYKAWKMVRRETIK